MASEGLNAAARRAASAHAGRRYRALQHALIVLGSIIGCIAIAVDRMGAPPPVPVVNTTAHQRVTAWRSFIADLKSRGTAEETRLQLVNRFLNRARLLERKPLRAHADAWATPEQFVSAAAGAAHDFVIAKYYTLKAAGIPASKLEAAHVINRRTSQAHVVLLYRAAPDADPLILDALDDTVSPASQRPDLEPVYSVRVSDLLEARARVGRSPGWL